MNTLIPIAAALFTTLSPLSEQGGSIAREVVAAVTTEHADTTTRAAPHAVLWRVPDQGRIPKLARHATSVIEVDRSALHRLAAAGGGTFFDVPLGPALDVDLELATIDPFEADAEVEISSRDVDAATPLKRRLASDVDRGAHFVGVVRGHSNSHVFLSASAAGTYGYVEFDGRTFIISSGPFGSRTGIASYELTALPPEFVESLLEPQALNCATAEPSEPILASEGGLAGTPPCRQIRIAWETDQEFLALFGGDTTAATGYVGTLAAALTSIYTRDVNARLSVRYLRLWSSTDPWTATSTSTQLEEFSGYWQLQMGSITRDLAHFLSGRNLGGGVAYLPGICNGGYNYGVSANLDGFFPTPLVDNNGQNWDIIVVAHELGHNFGAPHTHSYVPPLDGCGLSPQDCAVATADEGTIMSYCHLCSGGVQNIKLQFHPSNIQSMEERLAAVGCSYTGPATLPFGASDRVQTIAGIPVTIDVLANEIDFNCESIEIGTFTTPSQGGVVTRSVGTGPGGRDQLVYEMPTASFAGNDVFTYRVRDASAQETIVSVTVEISPVRVPENPVADVPQLDVNYYVLSSPTVLPNFATLSPYQSGSVAQVNYASTTGNFATSGRSNNVGAVFTGWVTVPESGLWTFYTNSDEGSRLLIGSNVVVSNDGIHAMLEKSGSIALAAGTHAIRIEFFERTGGAGLIASWQGPTVAKAAIPAAALTRGGTNPASDIDNDGDIDAADLAILLGAWGQSGGASDVNRDGTVNAADLAILLSAWTG